MDGKHCGEQILAARRRAGLSQEGLATLVGVSPQAVRKWECGKTYPRRDKWPLLEQKMNLSPGWFFALQAEGESDVLRQNVAQTGVNHGTVAGVVNNAPPFNSPHSQGGDEKRRNFDQTLTGWFAGVCDWWATEHGTDSSSPSAFFREFDRRFPEYVAWSRIEKK